MNGEHLKIIALSLLAGIFALFIIRLLAHFIKWKIVQKRNNIVIENSRKIPIVLELNEQFDFYQFNSVYDYQEVCESKAKYDHCSLNDCLLKNVKMNEPMFKELVDRSISNKSNAFLYEDSFDKILSDDTEEDIKLYSKYKFFQKVENEFCQDRKLFPATDITVRVEKIHISPGGRNVYSDHYYYHTDDIIECFDKIESES